MRFFRSSASRGALLFLLTPGAQITALACEPARIDVSVTTKPAVTGVPLRIEIELRDENGGGCPGNRDYSIHLDAVDSDGRPQLLSHPDITVPRHHHDPPEGQKSFVTVNTPGLISIKATSRGIRDGIANVFVRALSAPAPRRRAQSAWLIPAAFDAVADEVPVIAYCEKGGQVSANGNDSIVVVAQLEDGRPVPYPVDMTFATGSIEWDGTITIPAGATEGRREIRSHRIGRVELTALLTSKPVTVSLDPHAGAYLKKGCEFISPTQYADLEFQARRISYGEPVQLSIVFRDLEHNPVPADNASEASIQVLAGRQPSFTPLQHQKDGSATLICKPNWWGSYEFQWQGAKTVSRGAGDGWTQGPVALTVTFPSIPFWFCILFGSTGAMLLALQRREFDIQRLAIRIAIGIGAALLLVSATLGASLLKTNFTPTLLILPLALTAGWCGPAVFTWYAGRLGINAPGLEPERAPTRAAAAGDRRR